MKIEWGPQLADPHHLLYTSRILIMKCQLQCQLKNVKFSAGGSPKQIFSSRECFAPLVPATLNVQKCEKTITTWSIENRYNKTNSRTATLASITSTATTITQRPISNSSTHQQQQEPQQQLHHYLKNVAPCGSPSSRSNRPTL